MKRIYFLATLMLLASFSFAQTMQKSATGNGLVHNSQPDVITSTSNSNNIRATLFTEDFESGTLAGWTTADQDGDTYNWENRDAAGDGGFNSNNCATSASWLSGGVGALTPENWLISPAIDLTTGTGTLTLDYQISAQDPNWEYEHYKLVVSTATNAVADFTTILHEETMPLVGATRTWLLRSINLTAYAGQTIYLAWVHYDCTNMYYMNLDEISIYENTVIDAGITAATAPDNGGGCQLTATEDVTITIFNYGGAAITGFDVSYDVDGANTVTETVGATIAAGESANYTFTQQVDLSALGYYTMNFAVALTDDSNAANNTFTKAVSSTDAVITIHTFSDSQGDQTWSIKNSADQVVASGGNYQWALEESINVCVIANDCYTFTFSGFDATGWVEVLYNGSVVAGNQSAGNSTGGVTFYSIGGGCAAIDAKLVSLDLPNYMQPGNLDISGVIQNLGADPITSFDVTYTIDGGAASATYSVAGQNIATGATANFTHDVAAALNTEQTYSIAVSISNINAGTDANMADNSLSKNVVVTTAMIQRKMIFENFTTGQCPNCPPVITSTEAYAAANPNAILIAQHSGYFTDEMTIAENTELLAFYNDGGSTYAPALMIDRHYYTTGFDGGAVDPGPVFFPGNVTAMNARLDARLAEPAFVSVNIAATLSATKELSLTVSGEVLADVAGNDLRVVVYLLEDGLLYAQAGQAANPFTHNDVLRDAIPSTYGTAGTVSANTTGTTYSENYTYQLGATWDPAEMKIVAFVANYDAGDVKNREILNAEEIHMPAVANSIDVLNSNIGIYPNPANNYVKVTGAENANVQIIDITGKVVMTQKLDGNYLNIANLTQGQYILKVVGQKNTSIKKIVVRR